MRYGSVWKDVWRITRRTVFHTCTKDKVISVMNVSSAAPDVLHLSVVGLLQPRKSTSDAFLIVSLHHYNIYIYIYMFQLETSGRSLHIDSNPFSTNTQIHTKHKYTHTHTAFIFTKSCFDFHDHEHNPPIDPEEPDNLSNPIHVTHTHACTHTHTRTCLDPVWEHCCAQKLEAAA